MPAGESAADSAGERPPARTAHGIDRTVALMGARIRDLRSQQGLTLKEVAERTGVSVSMLSMLERGVATASVGTLVSVASALGTHMHELFDQPARDEESPVTRLDEQTEVRMGTGATRRVAHLDMAAGLEFVVNRYDGFGASGSSATHHPGREFGVLVSGHLSVEIDGRAHELGPGDAIAYSSLRPHRIVNNEESTAVAVWVNVDSGAGTVRF